MLAGERAKRKAEFCVASGVQPSEYELLTGHEVAAFIEVINEANRKRR
jgi:hypothetical protein